MKYFLAYETRGGKIVKIEKKGVVPSSSNFKDILDFTLAFESVSDLKDFLYKNKLLSERYYSVYYMSQTKKDDLSTIRKIPYSDLKFKPDSEFYNPIYLKRLLEKRVLSVNFITLMTSKYIRKLGVKKYIYEDILNRLGHAYEIGMLSRELESIKCYFESKQILAEINDFIKALNAKKMSVESIYSNIEYLAEIIRLQDFETLNYYSHVRERLLKTKAVVEPPVISELFRIKAKYYYNKSVKEYYEPISYEENVDNLLKLIICKYGELKNSSGKPILKNGKKQKGFIVKDGLYVIKPRELYELGSFLKEYEENNRYYEYSEEVINDIDTAIDENKDDFEEFLTEDDYKRLN